MVTRRIFLYLDDLIVRQFLAQTEGGEFDDQRIKDQSSTQSGLGIGVHSGPLTANANRGSGGSSESELVLRQTPQARFNRLHNELRAEKLDTLSAADETIWSQLEIGELLEFVVEPELPEFIRSAAQVGQLKDAGEIIDLVDQLGQLGMPEMSLEADQQQTLRQVKALLPAIGAIDDAMESGPVPCTFRLAQAPKFALFSMLDRTNLMVTVDKLQGEVHLLAKIDRLIAKGNPENVSLLPGLPQLNRQQRRTSNAGPSLTIRYPTVAVTAIALYR
jgi:hypothetical protein